MASDGPADPPDDLRRRRRYVRLTDLPARVRVGDVTRRGNEFELEIAVEPYRVPEGGAEVVPMRPEEPDEGE